MRSFHLQRRRIQQRQRAEGICHCFAAFDAKAKFCKPGTDVVPVAILHASEQAMAERELEIRFDGERLGIAGNGHGVLPQLIENLAAIEVYAREIRLQCQRLVIARKRGLGLAEFIERIAAIVMGIGVTGLQRASALSKLIRAAEYCSSSISALP